MGPCTSAFSHVACLIAWQMMMNNGTLGGMLAIKLKPPKERKKSQFPLAAQFESLVHPFTIMMAIPLEVVGVFLALFITREPVSVSVLHGILMLTGIVVSNSILLVNYINILWERGIARRAAILEAGPVRLRPILMTAIATVFAMIPMAMALREGSEIFRPLAIAVIGGLLTTVLPLTIARAR